MIRRARRLPVELLAQLALVGATIGLVAVGGGSILNLAFTPMALGVGIFLFIRTPTRDYVSFCLWLWMLAPLVRRLADWQSGFHVISPIIVAPLLVTLLSFLRASRQSFWRCVPFNVIMFVCVYGLFLGVLHGETFAAVFAALNWLAPLGFACLILSFPATANISQIVFDTLVRGGLVIGVYGIWQYFAPPPWDAYWMISADMRSIGLPLPQQIRVFSTMNSPGPFALMLSAALLAMFAGGGRLRWLAAPPALAGFVLSLVRSSWGGFVLGLGVLVLFGRGKSRFRYIAIGATAAFLALPLLMYEPIATPFLNRVATISSIEDDGSYNARLAFSSRILENISSLVIGSGLGATGLAARLTGENGSGAAVVFDNGILDLFFTFGLLAVAILVALAVATLRMIAATRINDDARLATAIALGTLSQQVFSNILIGSAGMLVFPFIALALVQLSTVPRASSSRAAPVSRFGIAGSRG